MGRLRFRFSDSDTFLANQALAAPPVASLAELAAIAKAAGPIADRLVPALLDVSSVFGALGADPRLRTAVTRALSQLYELGAQRVVATGTA